METKGKRAARPVGPAAIPSPTPISSPTAIPSPLVAPGESAADLEVEPAARSTEPGSGAQPATQSSRLAMALSPPGPSPVPGKTGGETLSALAECRAVLTHGLDALSMEAAALTRGGVEVAARTAIDMLAVRTLSDAMAVNAGFARASFDTWIGGSARFSELGAKLAVESWRPLLARLGKTWSLGPC